MNLQKRICVFCASGDNVPEIYKESASLLGKLLVQKGFGVISGAGFLGLMGELNDSALQAGGDVTGIIPQFMVDRGWCHKSLSHLIVTQGMAERKQKMRELSNGIIVLAGGCGTMEELFETITARQLRFYEKPIVVVNTNGFYNPLKQMWQRFINEHFIKEKYLDMLIFVNTPEEAVEEISKSQIL